MEGAICRMVPLCSRWEPTFHVGRVNEAQTRLKERGEREYELHILKCPRTLKVTFRRLKADLKKVIYRVGESNRQGHKVQASKQEQIMRAPYRYNEGGSQ